VSAFLEQAVLRIKEREVRLAGRRSGGRGRRKLGLLPPLVTCGPAPTPEGLVAQLGVTMETAQRMLADFQERHGREARI